MSGLRLEAALVVLVLTRRGTLPLLVVMHASKKSVQSEPHLLPHTLPPQISAPEPATRPLAASANIRCVRFPCLPAIPSVGCCSLSCMTKLALGLVPRWRLDVSQSAKRLDMSDRWLPLESLAS
jgi:hypothetical protein